MFRSVPRSLVEVFKARTEQQAVKDGGLRTWSPNQETVQHSKPPFTAAVTTNLSSRWKWSTWSLSAKSKGSHCRVLQRGVARTSTTQVAGVATPETHGLINTVTSV